MLKAALALSLLAPLVITPALADPIDVLPADLWNNYSTSDPGTPARIDTEVASEVEDETCAAYGVGYKPVPGTSTCIKVGGHLQMDVYTGRR